MADRLTKKQRSYCMSRIRSSRTKPELILKRAIRGLGFSYQPKMLGSPDFANRKEKMAIFVHGCFWHGCKKHCRMPANNKSYWNEKIKRNIERDKENEKILKKRGYRVVKIWEHDLSNMERVLKKIK